MTSKPWQSLFVLAALAPLAHGQGFYTTYQLDGANVIQTDAIGYSGGGICGGFSMWNNLNGNYVSGWAPADLTSSTWGTDGVDYPWSFGYAFSVRNPYGQCTGVSYSIFESLGFASTTSASTYSTSLQGGTCWQSTYCTNTAYPRCPVDRVIKGGPNLSCQNDFGGNWYETLMWIITGKCNGTWGVATNATGPGYCTPMPNTPPR